MEELLRLANSTPAWMADAACRGLNPAFFFPDTKAESQAAQAVCRGCPVRAQCLTYAIDNYEDEGVWGGTAEKYRRQVRQRRTN